MPAHLEWNQEVMADVVVGAEGRRHCEIGELPDATTDGADPMVNICAGCSDEGDCDVDRE